LQSLATTLLAGAIAGKMQGSPKLDYLIPVQQFCILGKLSIHQACTHSSSSKEPPDLFWN
jgi:hypothetical protein